MILKKAAKLGRRASLLAFICLVAALATIPGPARARYASIVIDAGTGDVLHEVNANTRNYPASLTKMMTLYLAFEALAAGALDLDAELVVSTAAAAQPFISGPIRRRLVRRSRYIPERTRCSATRSSI